jgi:glycosyltransferase involved in cell wall biosynthesis
LNDLLPRLLFVPVSGAFGMGEYARSLAIAQGAAARWPGASIQFMLSRTAPYAAHAPFPTTLLSSSPTFHSAAVIEFMNTWRPDVVIFDNAGRTAQLRAARRSGARVVYISARPRQRAKAFRLRWMRIIDEHWIAYPEFIAGSLRFCERVKLRLLGRPKVRYLDVVLARDPIRDAAGHGSAHGRSDDSLIGRIGGGAGGYVLVVPGGGTDHPGAGGAVDRFLQAARALAQSGVDTVFVGSAGLVDTAAAAPGAAATGAASAAAASTGTAFTAGTCTAAASTGTASMAEVFAATPSIADGARLRLPGPLPQADLAALMRGARLIVANGGSTLLQAIACGRPCIAVPIAGDQAQRIRRCVAAGLALAAPLDADAITQLAVELLRDDRRREALAGRAAAQGLADGVEVALNALDALLAAA